MTFQAFILQRIKTGETSLTLTVLSCEHGKQRIKAKGALAPRSPLIGILDLMHQVELRLAPCRDNSMPYLGEATLLCSFPAIRLDYARMCAACYFLETVAASLEERDPSPEIYGLLSKALHYLNEKKPSISLLQRFESRLVSILGFGGERSSAPDHPQPFDALAQHIPYRQASRLVTLRQNLAKAISEEPPRSVEPHKE